MKKNCFGLIVLIITGMIACNNGDKKSDRPGGTHKKPKTSVDSLLLQIDDGHINGMSKIGTLHNAKKTIRALIDSIARKPAGAKQKAAAYLASLNAVIKEIDTADYAMEKWMPEYYNNTDTLADNINERIKYLNSEKIKINKIKEAILTSLLKADSLLKVKF
jgi:uncharacterized UPF0160 family protein